MPGGSSVDFWVSKRSETRTSGLRMARRIIPILPAESWDLRILLRANLHVSAEPPQGFFPVRKPLARLCRSNVPGSRHAHELNRNIAHHLQGHVELFRLLNGAAQIVFRMQEERGSGDTSSIRQRRTLAIVILALRVPGIALGLQDLPEANI